jgi:hypothetical protein
VRSDRLSSRKNVLVKCPRCGLVYRRRFPYGCCDVMPFGGCPRYFCDDCLRIIDGIECNECRVFIYSGGMS